mmetsp:Transcript_11695/g.33640  ORF Transcript_11695/g.33640 Transcript_11695/m.33640 type:complete len:140 (-) Transcript_11695:705-1124(-)
MSVYQKIFQTTTRRAAASAAFAGKNMAKSVQSSGHKKAIWAFPAGVAASWFIFDALTDEIKQGFGLYYDPQMDVNRVEMERMKRMDERAAIKAAKDAAKGGSSDDDEEEDEEDEDDVSAAVSKAVASAMDDDEDDEEDE